VCAVLGGLVLVAFVVVARPSPSVLRAALMGAAGLVSLATGRAGRALPVLSATTLVLLSVDPGLAGDAGFALSVLATAALLLVAPGWARGLTRLHVPPVVAESVAVAAAAHLVTAPVIAALSGRVSLVAVPANVLAEPVVAPATVLGFGAAVVGPASSDAARLLAWLAGWPCRWLVGVADRLGGVAGAAVSWPAGCCCSLRRPRYGRWRAARAPGPSSRPGC
jgi:competence protein ComEC